MRSEARGQPSGDRRAAGEDRQHLGIRPAATAERKKRRWAGSIPPCGPRKGKRWKRCKRNWTSKWGDEVTYDQFFQATLLPLPCPVSKEPAGGRHETYATFNEVLGTFTGYASNQPSRLHHTVQVHVFSKCDDGTHQPFSTRPSPCCAPPACACTAMAPTCTRRTQLSPHRSDLRMGGKPRLMRQEAQPWKDIFTAFLTFTMRP